MQATSSFVAKVPGEVLAHFDGVALKRRSSMQNRLFRLSGRILCEQFPRLLLVTCLAFFCLGEFGLSVYGSCFLSRTLA
jgi:hypothetical protein